MNTRPIAAADVASRAALAGPVVLADGRMALARRHTLTPPYSRRSGWPQVSKELLQLRVRLPDLRGQLPEIGHGLGTPHTREILVGGRAGRHRPGFVVPLAHGRCGRPHRGRSRVLTRRGQPGR